MATLTFTGSTSGTFSVAANWSPAQVPTSADICIFTASSPTCSLTTLGTCSQVDFSSYNKRISFSSNALAVYGNITLGSQMSFTFSASSFYSGYNLVMVATGSITPNGMTMGVPFMLYNLIGSNNTYTLNNNLICGENFASGANAGGLTNTINGFTISCYKNVGINIVSVSSLSSTTGTTTIVMLGTASPVLTSGAATTNGFANNFIINTTATVTTGGNTVYYKTGTFKILNGKLSSTLTLVGSATLDFSGSNSNNVQLITLGCSVTGNTITLLSDMHILGFANTNIVSTIINGGDMYCYGTTPFSLQGAASTSVTGTSTIRISGTSSSSTATIFNTGYLSCNFSIQTPGTLNFNQFNWYAPSTGDSFIYTSGTMLSTGSNFQICNATNNIHTFYTSGMTFNNIKPTSGGTSSINLQQQLNVTSLSPISGALVFTGSYGFSASTLALINPPSTRTGMTLVSGLTYNVYSNFTVLPGTLLGGSGFVFGIKSNTPGQQAKLILAYGASQSLYTVVTDDIDSSAGQTIWPYYYDVATASTNTLNWNRLQYSSLQSSNLNIS